MTRACGVWMMGPALEARGGMSAVVQSYREAGLFERWTLRYVPTYLRPGLVLQLRVFGLAWLRLLLALLRGRVGLLHLHSASRGSFWRKSLLAALARAFGVPYFFHLHSGEFLVFYEQECPGWRGRWLRHTLRGARQVLVLAPAWQRRLAEAIPGVRWHWLRNPVQLPAALPERAARRTQLLFLGRIREKKGAFELLRAFALARQQCPELRLVMAGDGEIAAAQRLAAELGLGEDALRFTGWIDGERKAAEMAAAGSLVLPSHFEGVPVGILEAMAEGLAVVATPVGGIPDMVRDGESARLVPVGDVAALAGALLALCREGERTEAQVRAAREAVRPYAREAVVEELGRLYAAALQENKG